MTFFALLGLVIALAAVAFVLAPLLKPAPASPEGQLDQADLDERRRAIYHQIIELEFDQRVGKLAEADARELSDGLLRQAAGLLAVQSSTDRDIEAEIEREILAVRQVLAAARGAELDPARS